jgi:hypothetical protein
MLMLSKETPGECEQVGVTECPKNVGLFVGVNKGTFHII